MAESTDSVSFSIRMPRALREELDRAAEAEGISTARQIIRYMEAGLRGGGAGDGDLAPLQRHIGNIERQTGKSWHEDVVTYGAVRKAALKWFENERPPLANGREITATHMKLREHQSKLDGVLAALADGGVIRKRPEQQQLRSNFLSNMYAPARTGARAMTLADLARGYAPPADSPKLVLALARSDYELAVSSETEARNWPLFDAEGQPLPAEQKIGLSGLLAMVIPFTEQVQHAGEQFLAAWNEDDAALNDGEALVPDIAQFGVV